MLRLLFLLLIALPVCAQTALTTVGGKSWGMGNAMVAVSNNPQSYFANPATISDLNGVYANSSLDSRFNISGLSTVSLSGVWANPNFAFAFAAGAEKFGDKLYSESKIGLALAKKIGFVSLGVKAAMLGIYSEGFTAKNTVVTEFGLLSQLNRKITIGFHAQNLTGARLSVFESLPTILKLGGSYKPVPQVILATEVEYIPNGEMLFRTGLEYNIHERLFLRSGINPSFKTNHFGLGYTYQQWQIDYAANTHPTLGLSHHLTLNLQIRKPKE